MAKATKKAPVKKAATKKPTAKKATPKKATPKKATPKKADTKNREGGRPKSYSKGEKLVLTAKGRSAVGVNVALGCRAANPDSVRWTIRKALIEGAALDNVKNYQGAYDYEADPAKHGKGRAIKVPCCMVSFVNWYCAKHTGSVRKNLCDRWDVEQLVEKGFLTIKVAK